LPAGEPHEDPFGLPDELFIAAKKRAADEGWSLRDLMITALRQQLREPLQLGGPSKTEWVTVRGGPPESVDAAD